MTETTPDTTDVLEDVTDESAPSSFTTESTGEAAVGTGQSATAPGDRKSTRLNSSHD